MAKATSKNSGNENWTEVHSTQELEAALTKPVPKKRAAAPAKTRQKSVLSENHMAYVKGRASGLEVKDALLAASMKPNPSMGTELENAPLIKKALSAEYRKNAYMLGLTREDVLEGMMEAVNMAKLIADPMTQVAAWREIAKICGFYAPEVKRIELSEGAKTYLSRLEQMPDDELLKIANSDVIDVDFTEMPH